MEMDDQIHLPAVTLWHGLAQLPCSLGDFRPGVPKSTSKQNGIFYTFFCAHARDECAHHPQPAAGSGVAQTHANPQPKEGLLRASCATSISKHFYFICSDFSGPGNEVLTFLVLWVRPPTTPSPSKGETETKAERPTDTSWSSAPPNVIKMLFEYSHGKPGTCAAHPKLLYRHC